MTRVRACAFTHTPTQNTILFKMKRKIYVIFCCIYYDTSGAGELELKLTMTPVDNNNTLYGGLEPIPDQRKVLFHIYPQTQAHTAHILLQATSHHFHRWHTAYMSWPTDRFDYACRH